MEYGQLERDFINRTKALLDQYDELVRNHVSPQHEYEVTLLINCLLGLLVYPQQLASRTADMKKLRGRRGNWLTSDVAINVLLRWEIDSNAIWIAGHKYSGEKIERNKLTMRQLIRQMRNSIAHAGFTVRGQGFGTGQVHAVEFRDLQEYPPRDDRFHMVINVDDLRKFVMNLADDALLEIVSESPNESD